MVCDKVVCERWCATKLCVKDGKMVCDKVVCERWCVKEGVRQRWCERWCMTKLWVTKLWVTKLCVKEGL